MKKWTILLFSIILFSIILWSCSSETTEPDNIPPTCSIISPEDSLHYISGDSIIVNVDAEDSNGEISLIYFYLDNTLYGSDSSFPYSFVIKKEDLAGDHTIKVCAIDNSGAMSFDEISIFFMPQITFRRAFGGEFNDEGRSVQQTEDGGYIITGSTASFGSGGMDVWLIKTDSLGVEEWNRTFGGIGDEVGYSIQITNDGGFIITGYTDSFGEGNKDFWLIKTDSVGNEIWNKTYGGIHDDEALEVKQTFDNGYILIGTTYSINADQYDTWLIKTDLNGDEEWSRTYFNLEDDFGYSVIQTSEGGFALTGRNQFGLFFIKTDYKGTEEWSKFYSLHYTSSSSIKQTLDQGYIITTAKFFSQDYLPRYICKVIRTDSAGESIWEKNIYTSVYGSGFSKYTVTHTLEGDFIVIGKFNDNAGILKLDKNGNTTWVSGVGGFIEGWQVRDGGYIAVGGGSNVWLVKTDKYGNVN